MKKRRESITVYEANGRPELAETEKLEASILSRYLPEQLSEEELRKIVATTIAGMGAVDTKVMGQVIGAVKQQVGNKTDGALLARIVKESL